MYGNQEDCDRILCVLGKFFSVLEVKEASIMSKSSTEVKYRAMATVTCEIQWLLYFMNDMFFQKQAVPLYCDSKSDLHLSTNPVSHDRTEHVEIDYHSVRE